LNNTNTQLYVITGGPGVGKTSLIHQLHESGFAIVPEDARRIIQEQMQQNGDGLLWKNKALYAQLMLEAAIKAYQTIYANPASDIVFFDRGIVDTICYMRMENLPISAELEQQIATHPYAKEAFILPPWEEIYTTDTERKQNWQEAQQTFVAMKETYQKYGYQVIEIPKASVAERVRFVEHLLKQVKQL